MSEWRQVKAMKGGKGTLFANIGKDGRMRLPQLIASEAGLSPDSYVELFVRETDNGTQIGVRPLASETAWSVKCTTTGKTEDYKLNQRSESGRVVNLIVPLKSALNSQGIEIVKRLRVVAYWAADESMLIVDMGKSQATDAHIVEAA